MGTASAPQSFPKVLESIGAAGRRLNEIGSVGAGAGNVSVAFSGDVDLAEYFPDSRSIELPCPAPALAGFVVLVTGSGCRLRDLEVNPCENLGAIRISEDGLTGTLYFRAGGNFIRPTLEFNSHLAVHQDQVHTHGLRFHATIHAQPTRLAMLSHIPAYASTEAINRAILRWQAETIVQFNAGIGFLPFMIPGSEELMEANVQGLRDHTLVLWAKHGVMARSAISPLKACDLIDYAETGADYEVTNLQIGGIAQGLTDTEMTRIVKTFNVDTTLF